jgi:sulfate adenylyltransferase
MPVTPPLAGDLELLANGGFAPLSGFLGAADYAAVVDTMRLANGTLWPIPIVLPLGGDERREAAHVDRIVVADGNAVVAELAIEGVYERDLEREAANVYGTTETRHPGVARIRGEGPFAVAARLIAYAPPTRRDVTVLAPRETRRVFAERGWRRVVGFQTRNPIHRAHEHLIRLALESADGVLVHPLVGATKEDDIPVEVRWRCYLALMDHYLPQGRTLLSGMPGAMRYAGPREAVLHMIVRQNHGCSHFVVGRDHAGVGGFYDPMAAQRAAAEAAEGDLAIQPMFFEETFWCRRCGELASSRTCAHPASDRLIFSGSWIREQLRSGGPIPPECSRPEVVEVLRAASAPARQSRISAATGGVIWLTGLSGAGKTTVTPHIRKGLLDRGLRVEVLDGDAVRQHLSKGLGFSREDRDENIRRIGYVASTLAAHGTWVIVAAISPYRATRDEVRAMVAARGAQFVEVFVRCPLEVAEQRDPKGLYKRARAGEIPQFTGVSDPYEEPLAPEIVIDTTAASVEQCAAAILAV